MKIENKIVGKFVEEFEAKFKKYLKKAKKMKGAVCSDYFVVYGGQKKFSDWDVQCFARKTLKLNQIQEMKDFILSYKDFHDMQEFVTGDEKYRHVVQHVEKMNYLQFMGFMTGTEFAPFVDVNIFHVKNEIVRNIYEPKFDQYFLAWVLLTAWRKIKNGNIDGYNGYKHIEKLYVLPNFSQKEQQEIHNDAPKFFRKFLENKGYREVLDFFAY